MRRNLSIVLCLLSITILLISCENNTVNEQTETKNIDDQIENLAQTFIEKMYTISYDNVQLEAPEDVVAYKELLSVYLTDDAYDDLSPQEMTAQVNWAQSEKVNLAVMNVKTEDIIKGEEEYELKFTFTVEIEDENLKITRENITGEMTIVEENENTLKIGRYYDQFFTLYQSK